MSAKEGFYLGTVSECKFILYSKALRKSDNFIKREVLTRILAIVSPIFFTATFSLKIAEGIIRLGSNLAISLKNRKWEFLSTSNIQNTCRYFAFASLILVVRAICTPGSILNPSLATGILTGTLNADFGKAIPLSNNKMDGILKKSLDCIDHQAIAKTALSTKTNEEMDRQWQLGKIFGSIYVINMDKHPDRLNNVKQAIKAVGLEENGYVRFPGCVGADLPQAMWSRMDSNYRRIDLSTEGGRKQLDNQHMGQTGCYLSHYSIIKEVAENYNKAKEKLESLLRIPKSQDIDLENARAEVQKYSNVLIIEDDNSFGTIPLDHITGKDRDCGAFSDFLTQEGTGKIFYEAMRDLPTDWDMLYFMALPLKPSEKTNSSRLLKLTGGACTNAYAINARMYPKVLAQLGKIENPTQTFMPVDNELAELHEKTNCFVISPSLAAQGQGSVINDVAEEDNKKRYWQCDPSFEQV